MNVAGRQRVSTKRDQTSWEVLLARVFPVDTEVWIDVCDGCAQFIVWRDEQVTLSFIRSGRRDHAVEVSSPRWAPDPRDWRRATEEERVDALAGRVPLVDLAEVERWRP